MDYSYFTTNVYRNPTVNNDPELFLAIPRYSLAEGADNVNSSSATLHGEVVCDRGLSKLDPIKGRGFCWSYSNARPTTLDDKQDEGGQSLGAFQANISNLKPSTKYYYRAYVVLSDNTFSYSAVDTFTTQSSTPSGSILGLWHEKYSVNPDTTYPGYMIAPGISLLLGQYIYKAIRHPLVEYNSHIHLTVLRKNSH